MMVLGRTPAQAASLLFRRAQADEQMLNVLRAIAVINWRELNGMPTTITSTERDELSDTVLMWMFTQMPAMFVDKTQFTVSTVAELLVLVLGEYRSKSSEAGAS